MISICSLHHLLETHWRSHHWLILKSVGWFLFSLSLNAFISLSFVVMLHCPAAEFMWSHISICRAANRKVALYEKNKNKNQTKLWLVKVPCHMLDSLKANQSSDGVQWTPNLPKRQWREQAWNSSSTFISVFTLKKSGRGSFDVFKGEGVRRNCSIFIRHHEACISLSAPRWVTYRTSTWICSFMTMINNDYYLYYYWWNCCKASHPMIYMSYFSSCNPPRRFLY